jgi:hypothetical protein
MQYPPFSLAQWPIRPLGHFLAGAALEWLRIALRLGPDNG